jgi:hypothetical protein
MRFPGVAKLADEIEGAGDEDGVVGLGVGEGVSEGGVGVGDGKELGGVMAGDLGELAGGDGAGIVGLGEDDFGGQGEEQAGDLVDGFIAHGGIDEQNATAGEIFLEELREFTCGAGIVGAVEENVGIRL